MIQELEKNLKKNGNEYIFFKRGIKTLIYKQINIDVPEISSYEVFIIRKQPAFTMNANDGKIYNYPEKEKFPSNEDFGKYAWTYHSEKNALEKFNELEKNNEIKKRGRKKNVAFN